MGFLANLWDIQLITNTDPGGLLDFSTTILTTGCATSPCMYFMGFKQLLDKT